MNLEHIRKHVATLAQAEHEAFVEQAQLNSNARKSQELHDLIYKTLGVKVFVENAKKGVRILYGYDKILFYRPEWANRLVARLDLGTAYYPNDNWVEKEIYSLDDLAKWYEENKKIAEKYKKELFPTNRINNEVSIRSLWDAGKWTLEKEET